ncbi:MAG TPA: winged helix-turn-helix domain-containing protein, partial [Steroidobacteraceae bacterium]|nr:winged helix-turn-helix domain-containing protein [Steroidobacteraceae bacterium]
RLVRHEDALREIWGPNVVIEGDAALYTAIRKVRRALGDQPSKPSWIETVPRKGYRFLARAEARSENPTPPASTASPARSVLAVLPLENLSGDPRRNYFSDGLTEQLISELGRCSPQELGVIARTSVLRYAGTHKSIAEIAVELGADYLIEGSVRHERSRARITLQLIRASDQMHVWSESFDRPLERILQVQAEIGQAVAEQIRLKLAVPNTHVPAVDPDVYDRFLRGSQLRDQRTGPAIRRAIQHFEGALAGDAGYAPAWAGLAMCYATLAITSDARPKDSFGAAREAAQRALALNGALPEAHVAYGVVQFWYEWNWRAAEQAFRRAAVLNPSDSSARMFLAHLHSNLARHGEAIAEIRAARRLDPVSPILNTHEGQFLYHARRYDEARLPLERVLELMPRFWVARIVLGKLHGVCGRTRRALGEFLKAQRYSFSNTEATALRGYTLGASGNAARARAVLRSLESRSRRRYVPPVPRALVHLGLGEHATVLETLEEALQERDVRLTFLAIEPRWDPLRAHHAFDRVRERIGLPPPPSAS